MSPGVLTRGQMGEAGSLGWMALLLGLELKLKVEDTRRVLEGEAGAAGLSYEPRGVNPGLYGEAGSLGWMALLLGLELKFKAERRSRRSRLGQPGC